MECVEFVRDSLSELTVFRSAPTCVLNNFTDQNSTFSRQKVANDKIADFKYIWPVFHAAHHRVSRIQQAKNAWKGSDSIVCDETQDLLL